VSGTGISGAGDVASVPDKREQSENMMDDGVEGVEPAKVGGKELMVPEGEPSGVNNTG
jgi:hypothetical protein